MNKPKKKPRNPRQPRQSQNSLPVTVNSYFKKGRKVEGYKRRRAGDANREEK